MPPRARRSYVTPKKALTSSTANSELRIAISSTARSTSARRTSPACSVTDALAANKSSGSRCCAPGVLRELLEVLMDGPLRDAELRSNFSGGHRSFALRRRVETPSRELANATRHGPGQSEVTDTLSRSFGVWGCGTSFTPARDRRRVHRGMRTVASLHESEPSGFTTRRKTRGGFNPRGRHGDRRLHHHPGRDPA